MLFRGRENVELHCRYSHGSVSKISSTDRPNFRTHGLVPKHFYSHSMKPACWDDKGIMGLKQLAAAILGCKEAGQLYIKVLVSSISGTCARGRRRTG